MRVVVLGTRGIPGIQGGIEKHCEELYPRLVNLGCDVTVLIRTPYFAKCNRLREWNRIKLVPVWCPRRKSLEAIVHSFLGILKARSLCPDVLHIHGIGPCLVAPIAKRLGMKVVMTHHGPDYRRAKWGKVAKYVLRKGEVAGITRSDSIIAVSSWIREHIQEIFSRDVDVIPNGVAPPTFVAVGEELERLELKPRGYVFTACRFVPEKGLHDLIRAYSMIRNPSFKLVIAGDADHETDYSRRLKSLAYQTEGVILAGFMSRSRLAELFSNSGLFVLPSYFEGLPIVLLEALSYELPVLVSDIPPHRELSLRGFRYFPAGNLQILSQALQQCFKKNIDPIEQRGTRLRLMREYDWNTIAKKTLEIYRRLL